MEIPEKSRVKFNVKNDARKNVEKMRILDAQGSLRSRPGAPKTFPMASWSPSMKRKRIQSEAFGRSLMPQARPWSPGHDFFIFETDTGVIFGDFWNI